MAGKRRFFDPIWSFQSNESSTKAFHAGLSDSLQNSLQYSTKTGSQGGVIYEISNFVANVLIIEDVQSATSHTADFVTLDYARFEKFLPSRITTWVLPDCSRVSIGLFDR